MELLAKEPFTQRTALISIADYDMDFAALDFKPEYVLQIAFNDVDNDVFIDELGKNSTAEEKAYLEEKYHMLTEKQAKQIAEFFLEVADKVEMLICQCEYGQSRSAAIAAAILEYRVGKGILIFAHENYYPNKRVFHKVLSQLRLSKE